IWDLVQGDALYAGEHHGGHGLRLDLGEHAAHAELVAAEFLGAHRDRDAGRGGAVGRAEVLVRHPHPTTVSAPRPRPVEALLLDPVRLVRCPLGLACRSPDFRTPPVPSPPGSTSNRVVRPLAQSATAMHISTRLLF